MISKITILLYIFISMAQGQDFAEELIKDLTPQYKLSNSQLTQLKNELKIQKLIIEEVQSLRSKGVTIENLDSQRSTQNIQNFLKNAVEANEEYIGKEVVESLKRGVSQRELKVSMSKFKKFLKSQYYLKIGKASSAMRRVGLELGLIYLVVAPLDSYLKFHIASNGLTQFAGHLVVPTSTISITTYASIKKLAKFRQIVKSFGSRAAAIDFYKQSNRIKKFFNLNIFSKHQLIKLNTGIETIVLTTGHSNKLTKFLSNKGWSKQLNYDNLIKLLRQKGLMTPVYDDITKLSIPNDEKLLAILGQIELTQDEVRLLEIKKSFSSFIKNVDDFSDYPALKKWALEIGNSSSMDNFIAKLAFLPQDTPPKVFDRLWRSYIIPEASNNIKPYFSLNIFNAFKKLRNNYDKDLIGFYGQSLDLDFKTYHKSFVDYIYKSLSNVNICDHLFIPKSNTRRILMSY